MISAIYDLNGLRDDDVISVMFTVTADLHCMFAPTAARSALGMESVPMIGAVEMDVPGALGHCVRVMMHVTAQEAVRPHHVFLHGAKVLRPDLDDV